MLKENLKVLDAVQNVVEEMLERLNKNINEISSAASHIIFIENKLPPR